MWIKFTERTPLKPKPSVTTIYPAGVVVNLPKHLAQKAIDAGKAYETDKLGNKLTLTVIGKDQPPAPAAEPTPEPAAEPSPAQEPSPDAG